MTVSLTVSLSESEQMCMVDNQCITDSAAQSALDVWAFVLPVAFSPTGHNRYENKSADFV